MPTSRRGEPRGSLIPGMEPLRIHLFGGFLLEQGGRLLPPIASRVGRSLLAYLVMHRGRPHQRDYLAGSFWPELSEGRARRRLSHTLWQIQDVLGEVDTPRPHLVTTADTLAFDPEAPYWLDVEDFERRLEAVSAQTRRDPAAELAELRACTELYRGDFLAGFYEDWVQLPQEHYRERYMAALSRLVGAAKALGAYEEALGYARRLTHHDPLREDAHQEVMRLCFLLGRVNDAIQQFERCRSVLAEELGAEPSEATVELFRRVQRHRRAGISPQGVPTPAGLLERHVDAPFVGREEERRSLVEAMERVLSGRGGVVLVEGEPGLGKSRLVYEATDDARWRGFQVLWGTARLGTPRPFAPLAELLSEGISQLRAEQLAQQVDGVWLREVARLVAAFSEWLPQLPPGARLRSAESSSRMQEALVETVVALGAVSPQLVVIDDVQWADQDTLAVLERLAPRLGDSRVLLAVLFRSEEGRRHPRVWETLRTLDRVAGVGRVMLQPLSVFELGEMVKRALGLSKVEPALASRIHQETGGNALFTLETLHALRDEGLLGGEEADGAERLERRLATRPAPLSPSVRSIIVERVAMAGEEARTVLEAAAVLDEPADLEVLAAVAGLPRPVVIDAVDDLLYRRLLVDDGDAYRTSHDQIRHVIYEGIPGAAQRELHRRAARVLQERRPQAVEALAHHFAAAGEAYSAARYLRKAARRAFGVYAYATAAQHFQQAARWSAEAGWDGEERFELLAEWEAVLDVLGERQQQEQVLEEMGRLTGVLPQRAGEVFRRRAWLLAHTGRLSEAEAAGRRAAELADSEVSRSAALVAIGMSRRWAGRAPEAVEPLQEAVAAAGSDRQARAEALAALGNTLTGLQRHTEAERALEEARRLFAELGDLRGEAEVVGMLAVGSMETGELARAGELYEDSLSMSRKLGYRHGEALALLNLGSATYLRGRAVAAVGYYNEAARLAAAIGNQRLRALALANLATVHHLVFGDDANALQIAHEAKALFSAVADRAGVAQCLEVEAGVALRRKELDLARSLLEQSLAEVATTGEVWVEAQSVVSLAEVAAASGELSAALHLLGEAERLCSKGRLGALLAEVRSLQAHVLWVLGDRQDAFQKSSEAVLRVAAGVQRPWMLHLRHNRIARDLGYELDAKEAALKAQRLLLEALEGADDPLRVVALKLPEHAEIQLAAEASEGAQLLVHLPSFDAPTGRSLKPSEIRRVHWTVELPEDELIDDPVERRRHRLLRLLEQAQAQGAAPGLVHLAQAIGVSTATVGRDLAELRRRGFPTPTRKRRVS